MPRFKNELLNCYQDARELAANETGLPIDIFPELCYISLEDVLNEQYLPIDQG